MSEGICHVGCGGGSWAHVLAISGRCGHGNVDIGNSATTSFVELLLGSARPRWSEPEIGRTIKPNDAGDRGRSLAR